MTPQTAAALRALEQRMSAVIAGNCIGNRADVNYQTVELWIDELAAVLTQEGAEPSNSDARKIGATEIACAKCGDTGRVTDTNGIVWPCAWCKSNEEHAAPAEPRASSADELVPYYKVDEEPRAAEGADPWETRELGASDEHVRRSSPESEAAVDAALGITPTAAAAVPAGGDALPKELDRMLGVWWFWPDGRHIRDTDARFNGTDTTGAKRLEITGSPAPRGGVTEAQRAWQEFRRQWDDVPEPLKSLLPWPFLDSFKTLIRAMETPPAAQAQDAGPK